MTNRIIGLMYLGGPTKPKDQMDESLNERYHAAYDPDRPETFEQIFSIPLNPINLPFSFQAIKIKIRRSDGGALMQHEHILDITIGPALGHPIFCCGFVDHYDPDLQEWRALC